LQILPERGAPTINRNFRVCNSQRIVYSSLSLSRLFRAFALFEVFNVDEDADDDDRRVLLEKLKRFDVAPTGDLTVLILLFPVKFVTISSLSIRGTRDVDVVFVEEKDDGAAVVVDEMLGQFEEDEKMLGVGTTAIQYWQSQLQMMADSFDGY
jgi:hypothetical protein